MMKLQIDFYRETGKWYTGGEIEIPDGLYIWSDEFKQSIVDNQGMLVDGWQDDFIVVTADHPDNEKDPTYHNFYRHLWVIGSFNGLVKLKL
jgi:hypothetical protein